MSPSEAALAAALRGRRCVVTGADEDPGAAVARRLVALDAEVHAVAAEAVGVAGLASTTIEPFTDPEAARRAAQRIGAVVDRLFDCVPGARPSAFVDAVMPLLGPRAVVVVLADAAPAAPDGVAIHCAGAAHRADVDALLALATEDAP